MSGVLQYRLRGEAPQDAPKGLNVQRFLQPINQIFFQIFILFWFIIFLSLFFDEQERNDYLL